MQLSLKIEDKQFLFGKYIKQGLTLEEANFKIRNHILRIRNLVDNLRKENKSQEDINVIFLEELERLSRQ